MVLDLRCEVPYVQMPHFSLTQTDLLLLLLFFNRLLGSEVLLGPLKVRLKVKFPPSTTSVVAVRNLYYLSADVLCWKLFFAFKLYQF